MATSPLGPGDISLRDFIEAVGSAESAYGTVSTAAVAGGLGSSLLLMAAALPQTRSDSVADRAKLVEAATALTSVQRQLIETIETETAVKLFSARSMPQASDAQRSERLAAIQLALRASADVQLGVALLHAGFDGARSNLEAKLSTFTDAGYVTSVADEIVRLTDETTVS